MGLSQAAAAAVVFLGAFGSAFTLTDKVTSGAQEVDQAWRDAQARGLRSLRTQAEVSSVSFKQGTVTINVLNTGAAAIDASEVDLLLNGVLATIATRSVQGASTDVWAPGETLKLTATAGNPNAVSIAGRDGTLAAWRA